MSASDDIENATALIDENLKSACQELVEWQETGVLCNGVIREAARLMDESMTHYRLSIATSLVTNAAIRVIANKEEEEE